MSNMSRTLALTIEEAERLLKETPFTRSYGFRVQSLSEGECVMNVPFQKSFERPDGLINGGVYMVAADVALWLAILARIGIHERAVTADLQTSFVNGAREEDVRCTARVLKFGKRLIYGAAECANPEGKLLTHHSLTYIRS
jgi:uncharacterized protein (TIGR00369 family)